MKKLLNILFLVLITLSMAAPAWSDIIVVEGKVTDDDCSGGVQDEGTDLEEKSSTSATSTTTTSENDDNTSTNPPCDGPDDEADLLGDQDSDAGLVCEDIGQGIELCTNEPGHELGCSASAGPGSSLLFFMLLVAWLGWRQERNRPSLQ